MLVSKGEKHGEKGEGEKLRNLLEPLLKLYQTSFDLFNDAINNERQCYDVA